MAVANINWRPYCVTNVFPAFDYQIQYLSQEQFFLKSSSPSTINMFLLLTCNISALIRLARESHYNYNFSDSLSLSIILRMVSNAETGRKN